MKTTGIFYRTPTEVKFDPEARAATLQAFLNFYDPERDHVVKAFTYSGEGSTGAPHYAKNDIDAFIESGATDGFDPQVRHVLGGKPRTGKRCGEANLGGPYSVAFDQFGCDGDTTLHERMHQGLADGTLVRLGTGLGHSHILRNGQVGNMGDHGSLMGSGTGEGLVSPHICVLGWNRPEETLVVTESQTALIAPLEMDGLYPDEYKHVIIGRTYLSMRQDYPYNRDDLHDEKLYIHELHPDGHPDLPDDFPNASLLVAGLMPGMTHRLKNGAVIDYLGWDDGIARVLITMEDGM